MSNVLFGFPIYNDPSALYTPAYSGGAWSSTLPLTNLSDRRLDKVARSSTAAITSTVLACDLQTTRSVGLFAVPKHTVSSAGYFRARLMTAAPILDAADFSTGWTATGTPTRSAAAASVNGIPLDLIGDDDGGTIERYDRNVTFTGDGTKFISFLIKRNSAYANHRVLVVDTTAGANRLAINLDFTTATLSATIVGGAGTLVSATAEDTGYRVKVQATSVVAANTNNLRVTPAIGAAGDTASFYVGDIQVWDASSDPTAYDSGGARALPSGLSAEDLMGLNVAWVAIPSAAASGRYVRINVYDSANSAGYVDLARLIVAGTYQPAVNMSYGAALGWEDDSTRTVTDGGAALYNERSKRRVVTGTLGQLTDAEALGTWLPMKHRLGTTGQVFFVWDPADTTYLHERAFLGVFRDLSPLAQPYVSRHETGFQIVEEL